MTKPRLTEARSFLENRLGSNHMRPFIANDGGSYVLNFKGGDRKDPKNYEKSRINTNATLRYDEWRTLDEAVVSVADNRLIGFEDLRRNGLVKPLGNAMGTTVLTWQEMSDALTASISIDPVRKGRNDRPDFSTSHIPIPVVHADYSLSERILQESRMRGNGIDVMDAERAARRVAEQLEDMLFGATSSFTYGGGVIYTYLTHPNRNQVTLSQNWDASGKTAEEILADVLACKQASINDNYFGPWMLYVPTAYDTVLDEDYKSTSAGMSQTIRQRILQIAGIQGITVVDRLTADNVLLVCMQRDVVDLIDGMPLQNVEWDTEGGFIHNYKVMTIQVPRIKKDYAGRSGVIHLS